jgi:hypothetical protein
VVVSLQTPADHLAMRFGELLEGFLGDQPQKRLVFPGFDARKRLHDCSAAWLAFAADIPALGPVKRAQRADFLQRDHQQKRPQVAAVGHVVESVARLAKETAEYRLDDVVGVEAFG